MAGELPFERPLVELQKKIDELKNFTSEKEIDFSEEIIKLEEKSTKLAKDIYGSLTPTQRIQIARHAARPTTLDYIQKLFTSFIEVHGDRLFGDDPAIVAGIAKLDGKPVTVIGHQKGKDTKENIVRNFGMPHPEGYRKALRAMQQANKFGRPIICFIDTPKLSKLTAKANTNNEMKYITPVSSSNMIPGLMLCVVQSFATYIIWKSIKTVTFAYIFFF